MTQHPQSALSTRIAKAILDDLDGRKGLTDCLDDDVREEISEAHKAIIAAVLKAFPASPEKAPVIPEGFALVPIEPTDAMAIAAIKVSLRNPAINGVATYRAMLSAAPVFQQKEE